MSLEWVYSFEELRAYRLDTKQGKQRLESAFKYLPRLLEVAGVNLPANPRVLSLMAGSCIEGIAFAKLYHAEATCVDVQKHLLQKGQKEAKRRRLRVRTISSDVREFEKHVEGSFDLVTILGSPLPHVSIYDFDKVIVQVGRVLRKKGIFLVEQSDTIFRILPQYRDALVPNLTPPVVNVHHSFSPREGFFQRLLYSRGRSEVLRVYLWSPWIVEYMLRKNGFSNVRVEPYPEPYTMMQTYLVTAQNRDSPQATT